MPNPATLHHRSVKLDHQLKLVDFYIHTGCPETYIPEPNWKEYKPDVYMKDKKGNAICVEIQITPISAKKLQTKIDQFVSTYGKEHDAKVMFLVSDNLYTQAQIPTGFSLIRLPMPKEIYT
jgi:competence CoiA-like predicted nuclease